MKKSIPIGGFQAIIVLLLLSYLNAVNAFSLEDLDLKRVSAELAKVNLRLEDMDLSIFSEQFEKYDFNEDNRFNYQEFQELYSGQGHAAASKEQAQSWFREADENMDSFVDYEELLMFSIKQMEGDSNENIIIAEEHQNRDSIAGDL